MPQPHARPAPLVLLLAALATPAHSAPASGAVTQPSPWQRDMSAPEAYVRSVAPNRERLRERLGATDIRVPSNGFECVAVTPGSSNVAGTELFTVQVVRWPVLEGVSGEGLLLRPTRGPVARIVALPDADQTPEMLAGLAAGLPVERQFARRLAEHDCEVLVPVLIERQPVAVNIPLGHRESICRQAFAVGRHIIGYEIQKVLAAMDAFELENQSSQTNRPKVGVAGYAEGGLLAFYSAALDPRIDAALVSGYFDSRQNMWREPVYRNVFGLLPEFGAAETATLISPRALIVEHSAAPPGWTTSDYESVEREFERARALLKAGEGKVFDHFTLISGTEGMATGPASDRALVALLNALGAHVNRLKPPGNPPVDLRKAFDPAERQRRQFEELEAFTRKLSRPSEPALK